MYSTSCRHSPLSVIISVLWYISSVVGMLNVLLFSCIASIADYACFRRRRTPSEKINRIGQADDNETIDRWPHRTWIKWLSMSSLYTAVVAYCYLVCHASVFEIILCQAIAIAASVVTFLIIMWLQNVWHYYGRPIFSDIEYEESNTSFGQ